jgi:hypothetical protein
MLPFDSIEVYIANAIDRWQEYKQRKEQEIR